jgi:hypothetical protein
MNDETSSVDRFVFDLGALKSEPIAALPSQDLEWALRLGEKYRDFFSLPIPDHDTLIVDCHDGDDEFGAAV